jgi:hypothetical protein
MKPKKTSVTIEFTPNDVDHLRSLLWFIGGVDRRIVTEPFCARTLALLAPIWVAAGGRELEEKRQMERQRRRLKRDAAMGALRKIREQRNCRHEVEMQLGEEIWDALEEI